jgi:hypothetical protein
MAAKGRKDRIKVRGIGWVNVEDYIALKLSLEAAADMLEKEKGAHALKAQAIVARSYTCAKRGRRGTFPKKYFRKKAKVKMKGAAASAVQGTRGQVLVSGDQVQSAKSGSACGSCGCGKPKNFEGEGLCLLGAAKMSEEGKNYLQILKKYFSGAKVLADYGEGKEITEDDVKEPPKPSPSSDPPPPDPEKLPITDGDGSDDAKMLKKVLDEKKVEAVFHYKNPHRGSRDYIAALQRLLHKLNYTYELLSAESKRDEKKRKKKKVDYIVDGVYGIGMVRAVAAFCGEHDYPVSGDKLTDPAARLILKRLKDGWKRKDEDVPKPLKTRTSDRLKLFYDPDAGIRDLDLSKLTEEQKYDYFKRVVKDQFHGIWDEGDKAANVVGVRSLVDWKRVKAPKKFWQIFKWNDSILVLRKEGGKKKAYSFKGSVDPSFYNTRIKLFSKKGCAHLCDGHWFYRWGRHHGHPAGNQQGSSQGRVTIWQDRNKDGFYTMGENVQTGHYGINIHWGGKSPKRATGSAGCQIIFGGRKGTLWKKFASVVAESPGSAFQYTLVDSSKLPAAEAPAKRCFPAQAGGSKELSHENPNQLPTKFENFFKNADKKAPDGFYPVSFNRGWHGGVHLVPGKNDVTSIGKGEVVAARMAKVDPGKHAHGSPNFVLIRHKLIMDKKEKFFFSLYMHLAEKEFKKESRDTEEIPWMDWVCSKSEKRLEKFKAGEVVTFHPGELLVDGGDDLGDAGIIGPPGESYKGIHFEVFTAESEPIIPADHPMGWYRIEDTNPTGLCDIEGILKKVNEKVSLDIEGKVTREEIVKAFGDSFNASEVRRLIVKHPSEWWVDDWEPVLNGSPFWKGVLKPDELKDAAQGAKPYGWWKNELNSEWGIPADKVVWHYHPLRFLQWLHFQEKKKAPS